MAATTSLREALNQGISSGIFIDTKIILYSHKDLSGRVSRPKVIYANSHVLKTVPYFNDRERTATLDTVYSLFRLKVLFGNFAESQSKDLKGSFDEEETAEDYGYLSDSDLEDDADEKNASFGHTSDPKGATSNPVLGTWKFSCEVQEENIKKGKVVKIPDIAFVTWVRAGNFSSSSLTTRQVPSLSDVSLHGYGSFRAVRVGRESQIAKGRNCRSLR